MGPRGVTTAACGTADSPAKNRPFSRHARRHAPRARPRARVGRPSVDTLSPPPPLRTPRSRQSPPRRRLSAPFVPPHPARRAPAFEIRTPVARRAAAARPPLRARARRAGVFSCREGVPSVPLRLPFDGSGCVPDGRIAPRPPSARRAGPWRPVGWLRAEKKTIAARETTTQRKRKRKCVDRSRLQKKKNRLRRRRQNFD